MHARVEVEKMPIEGGIRPVLRALAPDDLCWLRPPCRIVRLKLVNFGVEAVAAEWTGVGDPKV